jgi:hypothetical protein
VSLKFQSFVNHDVQQSFAFTTLTDFIILSPLPISVLSYISDHRYIARDTLFLFTTW